VQNIVKSTLHCFPSDCEKQLQHLRAATGITPFCQKLKEAGFPSLSSNSISVMQVNMGKVCNLSCQHCHVEAGPHRTESMSRDTAAACLTVLAENDIPTLDITGGSPEMNPHLTWLVEEAVRLGRKVMVRTNLAVLDQAMYAHLAGFYARQGVELIASLPCYLEENIDRQRGEGVYISSIRVLKYLNKLGYGREHSQLRLSLVYNPGGPFLPPDQQSLEADYRRELMRRHKIVFSRLYTITNVPVGRFLKSLHETSSLEDYLVRLADAFNTAAAGMVMCRKMISVGWDGQLYDCDFNQMLGLPCAPESAQHIDSFNPDALNSRRIITENHCYACTAGAGSSCSGAIAAKAAI
jgi:radical SAM/Cys-rich protein